MVKKMGTDFTAKDDNGHTALHYLCFSQVDTKIMKYFIKNGLNMIDLDKKQRTPFHYLCEQNISNETLKFALTNGALLNQQDYFGQTAFHFFCKRNSSKELLKTLYKYDADPNIRDNNKSTPINYLCLRKPTEEMIELSIRNGALPNLQNNEGETFLHLLNKSSTAKIEFIKFLLDSGADPNITNNKKLTPLHYICKNEPNVEILKLILGKIRDINAKDMEDQTILHYISDKYKIVDSEIFKVLFQHKADPNIKSRRLNTPFHFVASGQNSRYEVIELFFKNGANPNIKDFYQETPFHKHCKSKWVTVKTLKLFVQHGADLKAQTPKLFTNFFIIFQTLPTIQLIKFFLENRININSQNGSNGKTVLHQYSDMSLLDINVLRYLLINGADPNIKEKENGCTPLHMLAYRKEINLDFFKLFFEFGANVNIKTKHGLDLKGLICGKYESDPQKEKLMQMININFNALKDNFKQFLEREEFTDLEIKGIKVHSILLTHRIKKKINEIIQVFEKFEKKHILNILKWVYYAKFPIYLNEKEKNKFFKIISKLGIDIYSPKYDYNSYLQDLLNDDQSKDFTIIIDKTKEKIKVHRFIIQCRSELYRGMFLSIEDSDDLKEVKDYSGISFETLHLFIKYLYTEKIDEGLFNKKIVYELSVAMDFFQLTPKCSLKWYIDQKNLLKKKTGKKKKKK
ncbi:ada2a-containing complex component 3 [Anaeramoeba flamelloides]|uniref:Ada2a-containing complex component 3 n=1 Tax=Anaeramoeba flamelloides TaxID=1746091 RepID=A0ABQ8YY24_9EUKA|nr:ada2a-containing complex component 3 [Anaeramoeba flamelloides]